MDESGTIVWQLALALFCSYLVVYFMVIKGIKVSEFDYIQFNKLQNNN
jgi:hypothetical protein